MTYSGKPSTLKHRAWRYGLTVDQLLEVMGRHEGVCPIHGGRSKDMVIDHCHTTGRVRDLICRTCNTEVGWYENGRIDIKRPYRQCVIDYVARWSEVAA